MHLLPVPRLVSVSPALQLEYFFFWQKIVTAELMVLTEIKQEYQHIKALSLNSVKLSHFSSLLFMKEFFENHVPRKLLWYCD